jgi:WXG100 family type VII secretion target
MTGIVDEVLGIFRPGGDPDAIEAAANACRELANNLRDVVTALNPVAADMKNAWKGSAGSGFQTAWSKFAPSVTEYASHLDEAASRLDTVAAHLREAEEQATKFEVALGVTLGVGAALTIFSFGFSDIAAADLAADDATVMSIAIARLGALFTFEGQAWISLLSAMETTALRFVLGAGFSLVASALVKLRYHENPLDPANWSAEDATNALIGAWVTGGLGAVSDLPEQAELAAAHPILGRMAFGFTGSTLGSTIGQVWLDGHALDSRKALVGIVTSAFWGTLSGGAIGTGGVIWSAIRGGSIADDALPEDEEAPSLVGPSGRPILPDTLEEEPPPTVKLATADANGRVTDDPTATPAQPQGLILADANGRVTDDPTATPAQPQGLILADANGRVTDDPTATPAQPQGLILADANGRVTTDPTATPAQPQGLILADANGRVTTDPTATPAQPPSLLAANGSGQVVPRVATPKLSFARGLRVTRNNLVQAFIGVPAGVGQNLATFPKMPVASGPAPQPALQPTPPLPKPPTPPPVRYTVQPGDNLFDIAHGNPALAQQIAKANHLSNPSLIQPGQVLVIPPSAAVNHTVQPGESIWEIANGNPALVQQIIKANHLTDPSLIQPGQVLIIPPPVAEPVP